MGRPHVLTVYLFEINRPGAVLLDGRHQAVGFDDMVVAVQTVSAYENDGESRPAQLQSLWIVPTAAVS